MNLIPEVLSITATLGIKFQVTPGSIAMLVALGLCVARAGDTKPRLRRNEPSPKGRIVRHTLYHEPIPSLF